MLPGCSDVRCQRLVTTSDKKHDVTLEEGQRCQRRKDNIWEDLPQKVRQRHGFGDRAPEGLEAERYERSERPQDLRGLSA